MDMKRITLLTLLVISVIACSSKPDIKEFPKSADAKEEITNLQAAIENSRENNLDLLAPVSFKEAKNSLKEAKKMEEKDKSNEKVLKEVALGQAYLDRAQKNSRDSEAKLQDVLIARNTAKEAKADVLVAHEFNKLDDKVKEETTNLEKDKDNKISEKRAEFITGYQDLELAAIKKANLGESKALIEKSVQTGARDLTPKTLAETNKVYQEADTYITQNRHDTAGIQERSAAALMAARKLDSTTTTAKGLTTSSPEQTALNMQTNQESLSRTEDALIAEQGANAALSASNSELSKEQELNQAYEKARSQFTPEEAEVYKQGNNLVIRLRGLEFPKSEAVIRGENFALLKKVDNVIENFDKSAVIVEGHTDSTGGQKINQQISQERAEAVKKYLEANAAVDKVTEFESQGFGFEKPIATNKTPAGRAQNRRVDVIIQPQQI